MDYKLKGLWAWLLATVLLLASTAVGEGVEGGASMGTGGVNWRDLYYSFLREGAYTRSVIEAMKMVGATNHVLWHRDIGYFSIDGSDWDYFSQMGYTGSIPNSETKNCVWWWLRDPGNNAMNALYVNYCGSLGYRYSLSVDESKMGVRPAMWVKTS